MNFTIKDIMRIVLLAAMQKELELILKLMPEASELRVGSNIYYEGKVGDNDIIAGQCGIGKVNSAINTYRLIMTVNPDLIINSGVAGGVGGKLHIGDVLIADKVVYHDVWCGPGTIYGAADGFDEYFYPSPKILNLAHSLFDGRSDINYGLICSGDKFISKLEEVEVIRANFPEAVAVDMESASIAQIATMSGVPFAIVRVMSDTPGEGENISQYENFWNLAPEKTFQCLHALLENIN